MDSSVEKIFKPKKWPIGKTKKGGVRVRIEWQTDEGYSFSGHRMPKSQVSLKGSRGRRTGTAKSLNPFCGKQKAFKIEEKTIGRAFEDPKGDYILRKIPLKDRTDYKLYIGNPLFAWKGEDIPKVLEKL